MKRNHFSLVACLFAVILWSCNNSSDTTSTNTDSSNTNNTMTNNNDSLKTNMDTATKTPTNNSMAMTLSKADSMFVMEAAVGGMTEVEGGNVARQNAMSQRVKNFGLMMVTDHSNANNELKNFAASRGMTLPASLPASKQKMVDAMKKMTGKSFDSHYVPMMIEDHKKDIAEFKKQSLHAHDADLKAWAGKTLPTLQKHLDSILAIKKGM